MIIQLHPKTEEIVLDRIRKQLTVKRENAVSFYVFRGVTVLTCISGIKTRTYLKFVL